MTEDILDMMAKAKATKKKVAKKKAAKKVKDEVVRIPDKPVAVKEIVKPVKVHPNREIIRKALEEYKIESNIPITHPYWTACNNIRRKMRNG